MASAQTKSLINLGLFGHHGAGKSSFAEAMLYSAGETTRLGLIEEETSIMDFDPEEKSRKMTLSTSFHHFEWKKTPINLVDTPGEGNFFPDARSCMQGVEIASVFVDAVDGFKVNAEKSLSLANDLKLAKCLVINKLDKDRAEFDSVLEEGKKLASQFDMSLLPVTVPTGVGANFKGVIDLIAMKAYNFKDGDKGELVEAEIPDTAQAYREQLVEAVAEMDDALTEKYLEQGELSPEEITTGLSQGIVSGRLCPVFATAATKNWGVSLFLDYAVRFFPSPEEKQTVLKKDTEGNKPLHGKPDDPFCGLVIKTLVDPYAGHLSVVRVFSGKLTSDTALFNSTKKNRERLGNILRLKGDKQNNIDECLFGDIVALPKLKATATGETLCDEKNKLELVALPPTPGVLAYVIKPKNKGDEDKVGQGLQRLREEDPTLILGRDEQTSDILVTGMGQMHLEVTVDKLKRKFNVEVILETPKVPYKETIKKKVQVQGKYKKQTGGRGQYGDAWLEIAPTEDGKEFEFINKIVGGAIPRQYIPAVEKGIVEAMNEGSLAGYPVTGVAVTLYDGSYHSVDSSEMAFKIAGSMGFKKGMADAQPTLLEPIMTLEVTVPEENMGDVMGDVNSRRGRVLGMEQKGGHQIVRAQVPMAEILTYAPDLKSMTAGRGSFTMEFSRYEEVPAHLMEKVVAQVKKEKEEKKKD